MLQESQIMIRFRALVFAVSILLTSPGVYAESTVYEIGVDGLACPFCVYGVEKQLSKVNGVSGVATEIKTGIILMTIVEGATINEEAVRQAVTDAGFTMRSLSLHDGTSLGD
jgi:mercuric ion binding protein